MRFGITATPVQQAQAAALQVSNPAGLAQSTAFFGAGGGAGGGGPAPANTGAPQGFDNETLGEGVGTQPTPDCGPGMVWDSDRIECVEIADDPRDDLPEGCLEFADGRVMCETERGHDLAPIQQHEAEARCILDEGRLLCPLGTHLVVPEALQDLPPPPDQIADDDLPTTDQEGAGPPIPGEAPLGSLGGPLMIVGGLVLLGVLLKKRKKR